MSRDIMVEIGLRAIEMIETNVREGRDQDGRPYSYSRKPFARPLGKLRGITRFVKEGRIKPFKTKEGKLWGVIMGGYADWRVMKGLPDNADYLQVTGRMMRNLQVVEATEETVRVGFTDPVQRQKALWLAVTGAGRSRRLWRFLGLTQGQERELAAFAAEKLVEQSLERAINLLGSKRSL